jgi:scyllo-inositol 2-dehydrogenase (NADP+)
VVQDRWRERPGPAAGVWWDLGPHLIDQAVNLLGRPEAVTADFACQRQGGQVHDYAHVVLHYGPRRAILRVGCLVSSRSPRLCVEGTDGSFMTWGFDPQEDRLKNPDIALEVERTGELSRPGPNGIERRNISLTTGDYGAFYRALRDAVLTGKEAPIAPGDALIGLEILEAAETSGAEYRTVLLN